ncbi:MAG: hypothetical protein M3305_07610 [Actinomycetota bacterium]|nr:hypothetical protein [Actinomycetota bacterium]
MIDPYRGGYLQGRRRPVAFRGSMLAGPLKVGMVVFLLAVAASFHFWPLVFVLWWIVPFLLIPILGLSARGIVRLVEGRPLSLPGASYERKERELLEALERHEELTPARAALETSLSVSEADRMLGELAKNGHIQVRANEGRLGYALWDRDRRGLKN